MAGFPVAGQACDSNKNRFGNPKIALRKPSTRANVGSRNLLVPDNVTLLPLAALRAD